MDTNVGGWPLSVHAQWVSNSEADDEDSGYAVGAKIGAAKANGEMEFSWTCQDIEADAVIGTFNDSDFGGGGTDALGHIFKGKLAVSKAISLAGTYFINEIDRFQGAERDYNRFNLTYNSVSNDRVMDA